MHRAFIAGCAVSAVAASAAIAQSPDAGIAILTGDYGTLGAARKLDIVVPLQRLCGPEPGRCEVFCSETSFGRYNVGRRPICRVTYRCPDRTTRAVEAAKEELILLRCDEPEASGTGDEQTHAETQQPPAYAPPQGR